MYEEIKTALIKMEKNPKVTERTRLRDLISALSTQIRRTMKKGYSLEDIAKTLRETAEIDIKPKTLATYLHRYGKTKPKKRTAVSGLPETADSGGGNDREGEGDALGPACEAEKTAEQGQA